jgi:DNA-binding transcriptional LysR family regulator
MDLAIALRAFVRTVERSSMTAAARDLAVSQPAITKHLRNLERHVGARLLERSSRVVRPTAQGQMLYDASRVGLATIDAALEGVRREMGAIDGLLRIHAPTCIGAKCLHSIVMAFQRKYPEVTIDLVLGTLNFDMVYENFDIAIKYGRPEGQDLVIRRLGLVRRILAASPQFLARVGPIDSLERLSTIDLVASPISVSPYGTLSLLRQGEAYDTLVRPMLRTNDAEIVVKTLLHGHAMGPVQQLLVSEDLAAGRLVRVLPDYDVKPTEAFLAFPSVRLMRPVVRAFTDFVVPALRALDGIDVFDQARDGLGDRRLSNHDAPVAAVADSSYRGRAIKQNHKAMATREVSL